MRQPTLIAPMLLLLGASGASAAENLLLNSKFDTDFVGWQVVRGDPVWTDDDSDDDPNSGSVTFVSDDSTGVGMVECVPVDPGVPYDVLVDVKLHIEGDSVGDTFGKVGIQVFWTTDENCQDFIPDFPNPHPQSFSASVSDWQQLHVASTVPLNAVRAYVALVAQKFLGSDPNSRVFGQVDDPFVGPLMSATTTTEAPTTTLGEPACADPSPPYGKVTVLDAQTILRNAVGSVVCDECYCDADGSGTATVGDALKVLKKAVGYDIVLDCGNQSCSG